MLLQLDESSEFLPLVYDPASIATYWGKRPRAVATRALQLLSVAGGFLSRLAWDIINKKVKEVSFSCIAFDFIFFFFFPNYRKAAHFLPRVFANVVAYLGRLLIYKFTCVIVFIF